MRASGRCFGMCKSNRGHATAWLFAALILAGGADNGRAEQATPPPPCPPTGGGTPPSAGKPPGDHLSDRLAETGSVICPPAGLDPEIRVKPPSDEGTIKIIPAPGTPGGDPTVTPK